ncbi:MAG: Polaribacter phage [Bacteroidota bacterium]|jgi:hypothetical protein
MKEANKNYCDVSRVTVREISSSVAKEIIVKKHYTHAWTACRYALGIFYRTDESNALGDNEKLIGCLVYGFPVGARAALSISEQLTKDNVLELTRLYCDDGYGSNIESYAIGQSFKWFRENDKAIKVLISYADNGQEHLGGIYQATNWIYQGMNTEIALMPNYGISLTKDPYDWIHSRTVYSMWGSGNLEHLRREIGKQGYKEFWRREEPPKHRYIQVIAGDKKEKKSILKSLKHEVRDYPKNAKEFNKDIECHTTIAPESELASKFW